MKYHWSCALLAAAWLGSQSGRAEAKNSHVVSAGDTLWDISRSYGCNVKAIRQLNELGGVHLDVGQTLQIPSCKSGPVVVASVTKPVALVTHTIVAGETLGKLATHYRSSVADILQRNDLESTTIIAGRKLIVLPGDMAKYEFGVAASKPISAPVMLGQSIGKPNRGRLRKAVQLERGPGYFIRRPHRSYGATHTVGYVRTTLAEIRQRFPAMHDLAIGDLSARRGGKITMHASHQSGRDVDLGFYFKSKPRGYPQSFVVANRKNLHFEASWALLTKFTNLAEEPSGVDRIFMSYASQKMFYKLARKRGIPRATLQRMFQYPAGKRAKRGVIRHEPGHDEHIHVRFKCPPNDKHCY